MNTETKSDIGAVSTIEIPEDKPAQVGKPVSVQPPGLVDIPPEVDIPDIAEVRRTIEALRQKMGSSASGFQETTVTPATVERGVALQQQLGIINKEATGPGPSHGIITPEYEKPPTPEQIAAFEKDLKTGVTADGQKVLGEVNYGGRRAIEVEDKNGRKFTRVLGIAGEANVGVILPDAASYGSGVETIRVLLQTGPRDIEIPISPDGKLRWMRDRLGVVESAPEPWGSGVNGIVAQEVFLIIPRIEGDIGERMYTEFQARQEMHNFFMVYQRSTDREVFDNEGGKLFSRYINTIMHIPEVQKAFSSLERRKEEMLVARGGAGYEAVRARIARQDLGGEQNLWAVRLAERMWRATGRAVFLDRWKKEGDEGYSATGNKSFVGEAVGGDFYLRRVVKFPYWAATDGRGQTEFIDKNDPGKSFSVEVNDFWTDEQTGPLLKGLQTKATEFAIGPARLKELLGDRVTWKKVDPGKPDEIELFNDMSNVTFVDNTGQQRELSWFEGADLTTEGDQAYGIWMGWNVDGGERARITLMGSTDALFRRPNWDKLKELSNAFEYRGINSGALDLKQDLLERLVLFLRYRNRAVFNAANLDYAAADNFIDQAFKEDFLPGKRMKDNKEVNVLEQTKEKALAWGPNHLIGGGRIRRAIRLFFHYFSLWDFLTATFGHASTEATKA